MDALTIDWPGVGNWNFSGAWFGDFPPIDDYDEDEDEDE